MAITISGQNNNDKILASDGVLDSISGFNVVGVMTATQFDVTTKHTANHIDVGSSIQLGNAGIITATTLIGNVTGNVNSTSHLLLQISGSEKFRVGNGGQLGIGGANYGTSGQVLTSGGSGSAASWSTIASDKITEGNTEAEVVDTGSDGHFKVTTEGSERLRITPTGSVGIGTNTPIGGLHLNSNGNNGISFRMENFEGAGTIHQDGGEFVYDAAGHIFRNAAGSSEFIRIDSSGDVLIGTTDDAIYGDSSGEGIVLRGGECIDINRTGDSMLNLNRLGSDGPIMNFRRDGSVKAALGTRSNAFCIDVNGSERLRIDSSGNLLIDSTGVGNASVYARNILISGSSNNGMTIHTTDTSGTNRKCCIFFGTGTSVSDMADGMLFYDHAGQYMHLSTAGAGTGITKSSIRLAGDGTVRFDSTPSDANSISLLIKSHKARAVGDNNGIVFRDANDHAQAGINVTKQSTANAASDLVFRTSDGAVTTTLQGIPERLRIGRKGQIGVAGANYGTARETIVSGGASAAVSWSANPFVIDMVGLGDVDYGKMFVRYRETATVSGNGLVYLGICKSTTNCPAGRAGTPIGFIPSTTYNGHFRVDKIGITPWPDSSGHRYEYYAIISDYVSSGKLGVFYLTNTTS